MPGLCIAKPQIQAALGSKTEESADLLLILMIGKRNAAPGLPGKPSLTRFATLRHRGNHCMEPAERSVSHTTHGMQPNLFSYQNADRNDRFLAIERHL